MTKKYARPPEGVTSAHEHAHRSTTTAVNIRIEQTWASPKKVRGPGKATLELREVLLDIIRAFDPPMTVRQVYYQAEVRGIVGKTQADYDRIQRQLLAMRREGLLAYEAIADNTRWMRKPRTYAGLRDCLSRTHRQYRASVWAQLDHYVEIWLEKDALAGVLLEETERFDVPLMVCRGYSSESFAWEAAQHMRRMLDNGRHVFVYYLGDLDPSGWHAGLELEQKLRHFLDGEVTFRRLAVHRQHIDELDLPTRETKRTDPRLASFEAAFGRGARSCELDAMPPDILRAIVRAQIERHLPAGWLDQIDAEERAARETLNKLIAALPSTEGAA